MIERAETVAGRRLLQQRRLARRELELFMRRLAFLLGSLVVVLVAGSIGFALLEHVSPAYGFVWTLDTITTLGTIPEARDTGARVLSVVLELVGIGTLFYGFATVAEFLRKKCEFLFLDFPKFFVFFPEFLFMLTLIQLHRKTRSNKT